MAKASRVAGIQPSPPPPAPDTILLELSIEEARVIKAMLGRMAWKHWSAFNVAVNKNDNGSGIAVLFQVLDNALSKNSPEVEKTHHLDLKLVYL